MRRPVRTEEEGVEVRTVIDQAVIFSSQEDAICKIDIQTCAVDKSSPGLHRLRAYRVDGIEDQRSAAYQAEGLHAMAGVAEDVGRSDLVSIRPHARRTLEVEEVLGAGRPIRS